MSYTELDYLQEEVLGYFTEDKSDIALNYELKRENERASGGHTQDEKDRRRLNPISGYVKQNRKRSKASRNVHSDIKQTALDKEIHDEENNKKVKGYQKNSRIAEIERAKKVAQNQESTNESALAYDILNLFESEATDDICPKCGKRKCICDRTSKNECGSKC